MTQPTNATTTRTRKTTTPVEVVGRGFRKSDHALVWMVTSQSETNRWHQVTQVGECRFHAYTCDCTAAAKFHRPSCAHRDAVRTLLAVEEAEWQASQPPTITTPVTPVTRTDEERATAPLYRDNRSFSIWKA